MFFFLIQLLQIYMEPACQFISVLIKLNNYYNYLKFWLCLFSFPNVLIA